MRKVNDIRIWVLAGLLVCMQYHRAFSYEVVFCGDTITVEAKHWHFIDYDEPLSIAGVRFFYEKMNQSGYEELLGPILAYKTKHQLSDWIYYQLIRRTAQAIAPKEANYNRYTLYKWFLLARSGYDARLAIIEDDLLFYAKTDENVYDIPSFTSDGQQYVCLNYHDFGAIDFTRELLLPVNITMPGARGSFSYKIDNMPEGRAQHLTEKELQFHYRNKAYSFRVALNEDIAAMFKNYPVTDFESYLNIPMSAETYNSLIPELRTAVAKMPVTKGVDYLMEFTRNAFLYENDQDNFGKEKRLSPELTLFSKYSDCDDRVALFFYLVKEIYNLPMIVLLYPTHVTVAVKFDKPVGEPVYYNNVAYSVCDPTPQKESLRLGQLSSHLQHTSYNVAYVYEPR